uniref:Retroviral polymerase SH3-like domain-containing protein n=1 Tax=Peronospora matthiolae TaxID=2874970 RepID=A0AAV1UAM7_9STRA
MKWNMVESDTCMIELTELSKWYWGKSASPAASLSNQCPIRATGHDKSMLEVCTQEKPFLENLKVSECYAYMKMLIEKRSNLDSRSTLCRSLGYSDHEKAYRFEELSGCQT